MKPKSYPPAKREIIVKRPIDDIMGFCKEINVSEWKKIAVKLPPVNGFRKGTDAEIRERFKVYIRKIGHWNEAGWEMFLELWLAWINSHQALNDLLKQFENEEDFIDDNVAPPNTQKDIECFEFLTLYGEEVMISRELLKKFYDYGYFVESSKIEYHISQAKSELEFKMLETFREVDLLSTKLKESIKDKEDRENKFIRELKEYKDKVDLFNSKIEQLNNTLNSSQNKHNQQLQDCNLKLSELHTEINAIKKHNLESENKLNTVTSGVMQLQEFQSESKEITTAQSPINTLLFERTTHITAFSKFQSVNQLNSAFVHNFKAIGMTSIEAKRFSKELIAAIFSQATITFKGQLASMIANICAGTISGNSTSICYIPIGLLDGVSFTKVFDNFAQESEASDRIHTLIIEGVNHSPFEGFAARLSQYISQQAIGIKKHNSIIICTLSSEAVSLGCPSILYDSGPVFDTDCLEWRNKWDNKELNVGMVSKESFIEWANANLPTPENWEDLYEEYGCLAGTPSFLRDIFLLKAAKHLSNEDGKTLVQSLAFAWFIPRGILLGTDFTQYKDLIAEGKFDSSEPDQRIIKLLNYKAGH